MSKNVALIKISIVSSNRTKHLSMRYRYVNGTRSVVELARCKTGDYARMI